MEENSNPAPLPAPRKPMSLFKKIFYSIFFTVCFFGLIKVALQNIFPANPPKNPVANIQTTKSKSYTSQKNKYTINYPGNLKLSQTTYTTVFDSPQNTSGFPLLYVSTIPDGSDNSKNDIYNFLSADIINKFYSLADGTSLQTESGPDSQYWTFKKLAAIPVAGTQGIMIQNNNVYQGEGLANRRILLKKSGFTYIIGCYYKTQPQLDIYHDFVLSFKFLP